MQSPVVVRSLPLGPRLGARALGLGLAVLALVGAAPAQADDANLARGAAVRQSSTGFGGDAKRAVDGNADGVYNAGSVTHTQNGPGEWLEIDLGDTFSINRVVVFNRTDCCSERLNGVKVELSTGPCDAQRTTVATQALPVDGKAVPRRSELKFSSEPARYICIRHSRSEYLSLAEVEVYGAKAAAPKGANIARGAPVRQSSTDVGGDPKRAVDGNTDGNWNNGSVTHTTNQPGQWLEIDLGEKARVETVVIYNRTDCCGERLSGAIVELSSGPCDAKKRKIADTETIQAQNGVVPAVTEIDFDGAKGRYICIRQPAAQPLSVAEVEVYGTGGRPAPAPTPAPTPSPAAPVIVGTYHATHPDWSGAVFIFPNGRYQRDNGDGGSWVFDGTTLNLKWDHWGPEPVTLQPNGEFASANGRFRLRMTAPGVYPPIPAVPVPVVPVPVMPVPVAPPVPAAPLCPKGKKLQVDWKGSLYDATIIDGPNDEGQCKIHYDGWSDSWDEWVGPDRMK